MGRRKVDPLRPLTREERQVLEKISRSHVESAAQVARAKELLAVTDGASYTEAAQAAGRKSGDAVSHLVSRFNREGFAALESRHGGSFESTYTAAKRARIVAEVSRTPARETDGTATRSLGTLKRALRKAGLPKVSTYTIHSALYEAGYTWQKDRSWCLYRPRAASAEDGNRGGHRPRHGGQNAR